MRKQAILQILFPWSANKSKDFNIFIIYNQKFMNWIKKHPGLVVTAVLGWMLVISLIVSRQESTTMDEEAHIPSAYTYVKFHDMRLNPEHPPLLKDLAGIPLQFLNVRFPTDSKEWNEGINEQWTLGYSFIHLNNNNADAITFWSRLPIILIALMLGIFIYLWTKELAGTAAGLFAVILYAFDPNVLGHDHYVTTDIGIAAFIFISFYYFIKFLKKPTWKNTVLAGIFLGLVQLAKFSAVLLFPLFALIILIYAIFKKKPDFVERSVWKYKIIKLFEFTGKYIVIVCICFFLIWLLYLFNTWNMPAEKVQDIARTVFGDVGSGKLAKSIVITMSSIPLLKGLSEYFLGVFMVFARVSSGNTYYFFGTVSNHATPWYFPVVFVLKETLVFLALIVFSLLYSTIKSIKNVSIREGNIFNKAWQNVKNFFQTKATQYSMLGFILLYAYLSITGNLNIGFRHLFPILPFAYLLVSKSLFDFYNNIQKDKLKIVFKYFIALIAMVIILEPVINYPSYLSYFNEAAGGPQNGYKYVTDSNYDWGQDLKRLRNWVDKYNTCSDLMKNNSIACMDFSQINPHPILGKIDKIRIDYFGGSSPAYYLGDKFVPWHASNQPEPGWYALSAVFMQEGIYKQKAEGETGYEWLANYQPVARAGDSIFIFFVPEK